MDESFRSGNLGHEEEEEEEREERVHDDRIAMSDATEGKEV